MIFHVRACKKDLKIKYTCTCEICLKEKSKE